MIYQFPLIPLGIKRFGILKVRPHNSEVPVQPDRRNRPVPTGPGTGWVPPTTAVAKHHPQRGFQAGPAAESLTEWPSGAVGGPVPGKSAL